MPGSVVIHGNLGERGTRKTPNVLTTSSLALFSRKTQLQGKGDSMDMCVRPKRSQSERGRNEIKQVNNP
jgi:hypothetical protein